MNVLEIISGAEVNGAVVHCLLLSRELAKRGHRVTVLCRRGAWIAEQLAGSGIDTVETDMCRLPWHDLWESAQIVRNRHIDVIHTHMTRAHNFGVWLKLVTGTPCVATAHSHIIHPHWWFADRVIAVAEATQRYHQTHNFLPASHIAMVHGFVDIERLDAASGVTMEEARKRFGLPLNVPVVGMIGDILPRKGQMEAIQALAALRKEIPNTHLLVVGKPKGSMRYARRCHAEATRLGVEDAIKWAGYSPEVPTAIRALDIYILPSLSEMFPVSLLEAMASSRACVATAVGGVPECIETGTNGLLVNPRDPAALASAIASLLRDDSLRANLAQKARETVLSRFSTKSQAPLVESVLAEAARRRRWPAARGEQSS